MIIDPRDPFSPLVGHQPISRGDKWAIIFNLVLIAILGGGLVAIIAYNVYSWASAS